MPHALVTDYASLISGLSLPDPNDRHVLAAAIKGRADVIVTFNLKDFPNQELGQIGIEAQHPDVFFSYQRTLDETLFLRVVKEARAALQAPPSSPADYIGGLRRQGLQNVADELEKAMPLI